MYVPVLHGARTAVHEAAPAVLEKPTPTWQAAHTRSLLMEAAIAVNSPAGHGALTALHMAASLLAENETPASQAEHVRSAVAEPVNCTPEPAGQVRHVAHAWFPAAVLKVPSAQLAQVRSDVSVAEVIM